MKKIMSKEEICKLFGCTMEQLNKQYAANAKGLGEMAAKARKTGKKVSGYTQTQLEEMEKNYLSLSQNS